MDELLYDDVGDIMDSLFTEVSVEAREELNAMVSAWCHKHIKMRYWKIVGKVMEDQICEEDLV